MGNTPTFGHSLVTDLAAHALLTCETSMLKRALKGKTANRIPRSAGKRQSVGIGSVGGYASMLGQPV